MSLRILYLKGDRMNKITEVDYVASIIATYKFNYYMASSVSRQDEPNSALLLATQVGKMELSCPLGTTRYILRKK